MNSDFKELLDDLCRSRVRFLVVGGYVVMHHTEPRERGTPREALLRFGAWLAHMKVEDFCEEGVMFQIGIPPVRVDFLTSVPGLEFSDCWNRRELVKLGNAEVPMLGLGDLIIAKERAGRRQDELDLEKLRQRAQEKKLRISLPLDGETAKGNSGHGRLGGKAKRLIVVHA